jgi:hypothetical protein
MSQLRLEGRAAEIRGVMRPSELARATLNRLYQPWLGVERTLPRDIYWTSHSRQLLKGALPVLGAPDSWCGMIVFLAPTRALIRSASCPIATCYFRSDTARCGRSSMHGPFVGAF